jgi:hypothetical protein
MPRGNPPACTGSRCGTSWQIRAAHPKVLEDASLKLASVISNVVRKSGRAILTTVIAGETDPRKLARLAQGVYGLNFTPRTATAFHWTCYRTWTCARRQNPAALHTGCGPGT